MSDEYSINTDETRDSLYWEWELFDALAPSPARIAQLEIASDAMDALLWESQYPRFSQGVLVNPLTDNQREAASICYDQWRYLLHSVDGIGA